MLIAKSQSGKMMDLSLKKKSDIQALKKKKWYCPSCQEVVIIKNGNVMCSHFAHKQKSDCSSFSENESKEHLLGKKLIAENCKKFSIPYELEAFLPDLKQRPDILVANKYAIEFQCSPLSISRFKERTATYQDNGYQVIWILGGKLHLTSKPTKLQRNFIYLSKELGYYLWELDVVKKQIRNNYFLVATSKKLLRKEKKWKLSHVNFLQILAFSNQKKEQQFYELETEIELFHQLGQWNHQLNQRMPKEMFLQQYFYSKRLNLRELPCELMLPSYKSVLFQEKELILRHAIYELLMNKKEVTKEQLYEKVFQSFKEEEMESYLLVGKRRLIKYHVSLYLCFLLQSGIVIKKENTFISQMKKLNIRQIEKEILGIPLKYVMINK
ncbi:competence protein CoiA family protein [Vagococcus carniphilus]|uniref:competence protein CoiA n=1 Tax=Vagococcus carniphilus TaxID=218144 RepID=UPI002891A78B|nr:competence protein CoiA family protein [Vagococcus carniphilus]MDT2813565.1 competence protein CoiA family protein [Vagococcus carniphilus]MDT2849669.1 competence protein CoiA family protein [Vagococcus carniphilus]MDT2865680.1 competence protein CoiA family protein [Vagococcus carniphilus]